METYVVEFYKVFVFPGSYPTYEEWKLYDFPLPAPP